ncbi:YihA family ribosome biogenesis GTP-binding protein [Solemya pervernicosa gill symbiont]|uniref:Probable GTP-binding protein EngB n=2 Tax=Gammaproteobacteria incertae sedis TaxID=118884 RepID=A0A1T2L4Q7_9GAMM|nr:ribosome biogenesis GTP-binding protein YihA/YsxC [Candidatus Reidiella endopervernicosa]OOZ40020.1 YihA family ribosome biogenesis GTP-binding protein [Solemya pervernicosa gill symbiont]QKQ25304.1 YihA family ribosome biogenesis GTP-binding protein [Candidatus Reidiella endopervernicosa]
MAINFQPAHYTISAVELSGCPEDSGAEIAFAGRSNAGKSSALNAITNQKSLARVSKTPGRTQAINYFDIDSEHRLVDLPGYGYAKVPEKMKKKWQKLMGDYLGQRKCLRGVVLMMDIRHPLTDFDQQMIDFCAETNLPLHILLTKTDKLKRGAAQNTLLKVTRDLETVDADISIQLFSATKKTGVDQARAHLSEWLLSDSLIEEDE